MEHRFSHRNAAGVWKNLDLYQYKPFENASEEIRVLHLNPGRGDDALRGHLQTIRATTTAAHSAEWKALSYCWGETVTTKSSIELDRKEFLITPNLHLALRHLRSADDATVLWVDQICIDQAPSPPNVAAR